MCFNPMDIKIEEQWIYLPNDIIIEIFLKLPVRSLMQFMCVCKLWKMLISDPQFAKKHLRKSTMNHQHQRLFSSTGYNNSLSQSCEIVSLPISPLFENPSNPIKVDSVTKRHKYSIIGSCDGLLCLYNPHPHHRYVKLWNPCRRLESKRSPKIFSVDKFLNLECCGFGHDQVNNEYKAVLVQGWFVSETVTKVYNFGTNSLKTIKNFPHNRRCRRSSSLPVTIGTHVRSTLNWVTIPNRDKERVILSFDLEKETYGEVLLPKHDGCNFYDPVIGVLRNCLCVCFHTKETEGVMWLMKEYGVVESWTKLMLVTPRPKSWISRAWMSPVKPLCISQNSVVLFLYFIGSPAKFVLYDPINGTEDYPRILSAIDRNQFICHESLVSPL